MNNAEFNRLEKVLSEILKELQIQNKLNALSLLNKIIKDAPIMVATNEKMYNDLIKGIEETLKGYGLKEMK